MIVVVGIIFRRLSEEIAPQWIADVLRSGELWNPRLPHAGGKCMIFDGKVLRGSR